MYEMLTGEPPFTGDCAQAIIARRFVYGARGEHSPRGAARGIVASCRGNGLRVSFHAYNNEADVDAVVTALEAESALLERATTRTV